jgi:hypothetical protein
MTDTSKSELRLQIERAYQLEIAQAQETTANLALMLRGNGTTVPAADATDDELLAAIVAFRTVQECLAKAFGAFTAGPVS